MYEGFVIITVIFTLLAIAAGTYIVEWLVARSERGKPKTQLEHVRQFTRESGANCPFYPVPMKREAVEFCGKMVLDELSELLATVTEKEHILMELHDIVDRLDVTRLRPLEEYEENRHLRIADQMDAIVDMHYYLMNTACKHGMNTDRVFTLVHEANMAKKDPATGRFIKREDGKIMKPAGWQEPDIVEEVKRQLKMPEFSNVAYDPSEKIL
jgi:predicted HAD superfamily Cof-like phosphohydrolase